MRLLLIGLLTLFSLSLWAETQYDHQLIIQNNPKLVERFKFLRGIKLQNKITIAVIGDYVHTDSYKHLIAVNHKEVADNNLDDDSNGYIDDFYGVDMNSQNGWLDSPVISGHENGIVSLIDSLVLDNHLQSIIKILPINITASEKRFDEQYIRKLADAIDYARSRGAKVITMSLGVSSHSHSFFQFIENDLQKSRKYYDDAINRALAEGILLVGANSNDPQRNLDKEPVLPANSDGVIAVANVNYNGKIQSAYGKNVDLAFYGTDIYVWSGYTEGYQTVKGASFSTPLVALTLAVAKSLRPQLSYQEAMLFRSACEQPIYSLHNIASKCIFSPERLIKAL